MKLIFKYTIVILLGLFISSCAKEKKNNDLPNQPSFSVVAKQSSLQWTAYKTTDKVPVRGTFTDIKVTNSKPSSDAVTAIKGMEFEIPVSSIYSKDTIRDAKLNLFFFNVMENTASLKGKFKDLSDNKGVLELKMNGMSKDLNFDYVRNQDTIMIEARMDLNVWEAGEALESLNKACEVLHTGADGVSKTWDEVQINAKILTRQQ